MMSFGVLLLACFVGGGVAEVSGQKGQIWTITRTHEWGAHAYIDTEGYISGFSNELITLICAEAEMDCRIIWDAITNCWNSEKGQRAHAGPGLMGRWYDACLGYVQTIERIHTVAYTQPYLKPQMAYFRVLKGSNFDASDLRGKTIGFIDGWSTTEKCVARAPGIRNRVLSLEQIVYADDPRDALEMLKTKKIAAFFVHEFTLHREVEDQLDSVFPVRCVLAANSVMSRVDSGFPARWNVGFNKARSNGKFLAICEEAKAKHGKFGDVKCVDSY